MKPKNNPLKNAAVTSSKQQLIQSFFQKKTTTDRLPSLTPSSVDTETSLASVVVEPPLDSVVVEPPLDDVIVESSLDNGVAELGLESVVVEPGLESVVAEPPLDSVVVEPPFSSFDKLKLIRLAEFYPMDFSDSKIMILSDELETYILDVRSDVRFSNVDGIGGLSRLMVKTKKHMVYPLVYLLLTLALVLLVATATVERAFSAMRIIKSRLRNRMGDDWMNDCMITYIEKDVFSSVDIEAVMQRYQKMTKHRQQL